MLKGQTSSILIVDDQAAGREALEALLFTPEYNLEFAADGPEALRQAAELRPDLILLDVMMPGMDGFEVCRRLRADPNLAEVPIVMVTALDDQESRLSGIEAGADDFISKPFDRSELRARVRTITRLNRYRRLLEERLYRQEAEAEIHRRNYELMLLHRVLTITDTTLHVPDILYIACEALAKIFDVPQAVAILLDQDQRQFTTMVEYVAPELPIPQPDLSIGQSIEQPKDWREEIPLTGLLSEYLSAHQAPLAIGSEYDDPQLNPVYDLMHELGLGSLLVVPILAGDRITGMLELKAMERRHFSHQDLTLAQSVGTAVGRTIESIWLHQDLQQHTATLEETVVQHAQKLQFERDLTHAMLEVLDESIAIADGEGLIQYFNPAMAAVTGFSTAEVLGQSWWMWHGDKTTVQLDEDIMANINAGHPWRGNIVNKRKDGARYQAALTITPLLTPGHAQPPVGFVYVLRNIILL